MNAEIDATIGPILHVHADKYGVKAEGVTRQGGEVGRGEDDRPIVVAGQRPAARGDIRGSTSLTCTTPGGKPEKANEWRAMVDAQPIK